MVHLVDREYRLTAQETKQAIWWFLKQRDKPLPLDADRLGLHWNGDGEAWVKFTEKIDD